MVSVQHLSDVRGADWARLQELIGAARGRPERLGPEGVLELGALYRGVVADYAQARQHFPAEPLTHRLEQLALEARRLVYSSEVRSRRLWHFVSRRYWQLLRERPVPLLVAIGFLMIPAVLVGWWAVEDPASTQGLVPAQFQSALSPGSEGTDAGMTVAEQAAFSTYLITNNIRVAVLAFALGIGFCLGTLYVLGTNGLILGAIGGGLIGTGNGGFFVELVAAHGLLELSAIVVGAAAGLRMGWALVEPGTQTRTEALVAEAKDAVMVVLGTMPWFVLAGIIEAFVSRRGLPAVPMAVVGLAVGGVYWALVITRGRLEHQPKPA